MQCPPFTELQIVRTFILSPLYRSAIPVGRRCLSSSLAVCSEIKDGPEPPKQEQKEEDGEEQKAGKDNLLELLASMKVKVTSKKVWDPKVMSSDPVSALPETEGDASMSPEAVAELPPQRYVNAPV